MSVVVSCYNQEKYIDACLLSIINQKVDFTLEVIVSDDSSTDSTPLILESYRKKYPHLFKLNLRKKNVGPAVNYIDLHNSATGNIVVHMDGDDVMEEGKLKKQYDIFCAYNNVNIVFHRAYILTDSCGKTGVTSYPDILKESRNHFFCLRDLAAWGTIAVHSSYAYRRSSRNVRYLDREFMEWFFAIDSLLNGGVGYYIDEALVSYRSNPNGGSYLNSRSGRYKAYKIYFDDVSHCFERYPIIAKELYANYLFSTIAMFKNMGALPKGSLLFLIKNSSFFSLNLLLNVYRVRNGISVVPF